MNKVTIRYYHDETKATSHGLTDNLIYASLFVKKLLAM